MADFAFRLAMLALSLTVGAAVLFAAARQARAAEPKTLTLVSGDTLKAGDIFSGLTPDQADYVLGTPPQPGKDMVLDAHILLRIADTIQLDWRPKSPADKVTVRRSATIVGENVIRPALEKEMRAQGVEGKFNIVFSSAEAPQIVLTPDQAGTVAVKSLRFNAQRDLFEADLASPSLEHPAKEMPVSGRIQRLVSVPVLRNTLRRGDIIGAGDVSMVDVPSDDIQQGMVLKAENLVGMTPERVIAAGKPVTDNDIRRPQVVARGDFITLVYANGSMTLTAKGKAMQDAAQGDLVRVVNISSSRTLQGIASGDHEVTVTQ